MRSLVLLLVTSVLLPASALACAMPYERVLVTEKEGVVKPRGNLEAILAEIDTASIGAAVGQAAAVVVADAQAAEPVKTEKPTVIAEVAAR